MAYTAVDNYLSLENPDVTPYAKGTTGTGLDQIVSLIANDPGLNLRISTSEITAGAKAANAMNKIIVEAIRATGVANDGVFTASDLYEINKYIRANFLAAWTKQHGDDADGVETGFHLVQSDGAFSRLFAESAIDTVADGLYHMGFLIKDGRFLNEDGNGNADLEEAAFWLNSLLADDLKSGSLTNASVNPYAQGTTKTGLDKLVEIAVNDAGLNHRISTSEITKGAKAADAMNKIIVKAIKATGAADDGEIGSIDIYDINQYIRSNYKSAWVTLHGNDEGNIETGFHRIQGDGAVTRLFGENAINTVADGLYHLGFDINWGRLANEDGDGNASVDSVAEWLNQLLKADLATGKLDSGAPDIDPSTLTGDIAFRLNQDLNIKDSAGYLELGHKKALALANGTISLNFTTRNLKQGEYYALFGKDGDGSNPGDITAYIKDGTLYVRMETAKGATYLSSGSYKIEAGVNYDFAFSFGSKGAQLYLNGVKLDTEPMFRANFLDNTKSLVVGASDWWRSAGTNTGVWSHFNGYINDFTVYDRALKYNEIESLVTAPPLPGDGLLLPAKAGLQPAVKAGTGLNGQFFDAKDWIGSVDKFLSMINGGLSVSHRFDASRIEYGVNEDAKTVQQFLGSAGKLTSGPATTQMETIGVKLSGFVYIEAGTHRITIKSDDGFLLNIGGKYFSSYNYGRGEEPTGRTADFKGGLYKIDLFYFEDGGDQSLKLEIDGRTVGPERFFKSVTDYTKALADNGVSSGSQNGNGLPKGTTATGLDRIVALIATDQGLAGELTTYEIARGIKAADAMNHMIVQAIIATGTANDGYISTSDVYDIAARIRQKNLKAWTDAHGNDEGSIETGFHVIQGDGGANYLFGERAIDTVADGLYHMGFKIVDGCFVNEDGDANARVETVAFWLNQLLGLNDPNGLKRSGLPATVGSSTEKHVIEDTAINAVLADGALSLTLLDNALNATGNSLDNTITGNALANLLQGAAGNDTISGKGGADRLEGGTGRDILSGGAGNDVLEGGFGTDRLTGGSGSDTFVFDKLNAAGDSITDFNSAEGDSIVISALGFDGGLPAAGPVAGKLFVANPDGFTKVSQRFWFDTGSDCLYFDADGSGTGSQHVLVAKFSNLAADLTAADIYLMA